ncbi:hypothetical protein ACQKWADRAFT_324218 [Trichoderma austrokoningii]
MFSSREGVTLDSIAAPLSRWLLNPVLTVPAALALSLSNSSLHSWVSSNAHGTRIQTLSSLLAVASVVLSLNSYLDRQFANNWVSDKSWNWDEEIVLVTGGSSGIGASICKHFLARNARTRIVVVDYAPLGWKAEQEGVRLSYYQCDLSDTSALKATCERIRNEVGHPTVLFNNAGLVRGASVMDGSYGDIEATVRTNLIAPMLLVKEFIPEMVKRDHGHILHTGSLSCITPPAMVADYSATKAGLVAMHESLQLELKTVHNAPRVRLTMGIFCFIRTPLIGGEMNVPNFVLPLLDVDSVGESFVNAAYSGYGSTIYMPSLFNRLAITLRGGPEWIFRLVREGTTAFRIDFRGRQRLDAVTGRLQKA